LATQLPASQISPLPQTAPSTRNACTQLPLPSQVSVVQGLASSAHGVFAATGG